MAADPEVEQELLDDAEAQSETRTVEQGNSRGKKIIAVVASVTMVVSMCILLAWRPNIADRPPDGSPSHAGRLDSNLDGSPSQLWAYNLDDSTSPFRFGDPTQASDWVWGTGRPASWDNGRWKDFHPPGWYYGNLQDHHPRDWQWGNLEDNHPPDWYYGSLKDFHPKGWQYGQFEQYHPPHWCHGNIDQFVPRNFQQWGGKVDDSHPRSWQWGAFESYHPDSWTWGKISQFRPAAWTWGALKDHHPKDWEYGAFKDFHPADWAYGALSMYYPCQKGGTWEDPVKDLKAALDYDQSAMIAAGLDFESLLGLRSGALAPLAKAGYQQLHGEDLAFFPEPPSSASSNSVSVTSVDQGGSPGKYFDFYKPSNWNPGSSQVKQCRGSSAIWSGKVDWWDGNGGGSTGNAHGRRDYGAVPGQWQVGDVITTESTCPQEMVITSVDQGTSTLGKYFDFYKPSGWKPGSAQVKQCRGGASIWSGKVDWWDGNGGGSTGNAHGRRDSGAAPGQWQKSDIVTTGPAC